MEDEFVGQIIDIFEDFLTDKGVNIRNPNKCGEPDEAIIYGSDYDFLAEKLKGLVRNWNMGKCLELNEVNKYYV